jgi:O-antigen/teichoic acid export membrane protein
MREIFAKIARSTDTIKALFWNAGGMSVFYLCRWIINIAVVRMGADYVDAGTLVLAVSITSIWNTVALFMVRNVQATDVSNRYFFGNYLCARFFTVGLSIVACLVHAFITADTPLQAVIIVAYMIIVASTAFGDVFHGVFQINWRMDIISISYVLRGISILAVFLVIYKLFDLIWAVIGMALVSVAVLILYDVPNAKKYVSLEVLPDIGKVISLCKLCFPLVLVSCVYTLIPSITRIVYEQKAGTDMLGIYGSVTLPATIIQALASTAFAPLTNVFTRQYKKKDRRSFVQTFWISIIGVFVLFVMLFAIAVFGGKQFLGVLFIKDISQYAYLFTEATVMCLFVVLSWLAALPLTLFRYMKTEFAISLIGLAICIAGATPLINRFGGSGANYVQICAYAAIVLCESVIVLRVIKKEFAK